MARWSPSSNVGLSELIGRRLYEDSKLKGVEGQIPFGGIQLNHFIEKRDREVSMDRLGRSNVEKPVKTFLVPRATGSGASRNPPKTFHGWATVQAKELTQARGEDKLPVIGSAIITEEPDDNPFHAHVERPENWSAHIMALQLRYIFETFGKVEPAKDKPKEADKSIDEPVTKAEDSQTLRDWFAAFRPVAWVKRALGL